MIVHIKAYYVLCCIGLFQLKVQFWLLLNCFFYCSTVGSWWYIKALVLRRNYYFLHYFPWRIIKHKWFIWKLNLHKIKLHILIFTFCLDRVDIIIAARGHAELHVKYFNNCFFFHFYVVDGFKLISWIVWLSSTSYRKIKFCSIIR